MMIIKTPSWCEAGWIYLTDIENPRVQPLIFSKEEYKEPCPTHPLRYNPDKHLVGEADGVSKYDPDKFGATYINVEPRIIETRMKLLDKDFSSPMPHCWQVTFTRKGRTETLVTSENVYLMNDKGDTIDKHVIIGSRGNMECKEANTKAKCNL